MITNIIPHVRIAEPLEQASEEYSSNNRTPRTNKEYHIVSNTISQLGNYLGQQKHGEKWQKKLYPSEEKLRIWTPPRYESGQLELEVTPFEWSELQKNRQLQPIGKFSDDDPMKYFLNAVALTANALIETDDGKLIFHWKKGGAQQGSVHTFGGYVSREDIKDGDISSAIVRELSEQSELGLKPEELEVQGFFGTPEGMPAILWGFGTGAVYSQVKTGLSSTELEQRLQEVSGEESLHKKLYKVDKKSVSVLFSEESIHPQTKLVLPTIYDLYS